MQITFFYLQNIQPANSKPISPQPKSPATIEPSWMSPAAQPGDTPGFKSYVSALVTID